MTELNMVLLMRGEQNGTPQVKFVPATYDTDTRQGKVLEQDQASWLGFVVQSIDDMDGLASIMVMANAKDIHDSTNGPTGTEMTTEQRADLYGRLLASFSEYPMELVGNMLASMILGCVENLISDENFDAIHEEFVNGEA